MSSSKNVLKPYSQFILGLHSNAWWEKVLKNYSNAPYAELISDRHQLIISYENAIHCTHPVELMKL
jgi:hypothetical protein